MSVQHVTIDQFPEAVQNQVQEIVENAGIEVKRRSFKASMELRNSINMVLRGQRSGRRYILPGTGKMQYNKRNHTAKISYKYYTASAPGEPPAIRLGHFRMSWHERAYSDNASNKKFTAHATIESNLKVGKKGYLLGDILENGTSKMSPRPYKQRTVERALPAIQKIYNAPYLGG